MQLDEFGAAPESLVEGGVERRHQLAATVAHYRVHVRPVVDEDLGIDTIDRQHTHTHWFNEGALI